MAASETARLIAELSLSDKLTPGVNKALGSVGRLETGLSRATRGAGQVASGMARAGTRIAAGIGIGLAGAAKAAIDWEEAFTGVIKTVDEADLSAAGLTFDDLADGLRRMSTEMPNTAQELAGIAESAGAMGIAGKDILAFTKQVAILASTTNVSAEDAAMALGQLQNVIGLTGDEFDNFAASLVDLGNKGNSTESQILEIARRAGGAAKLFGVAKEETLGWAAAAANLGLNEELAGTALQNVFIKLLPKFTEGAKDLQQVTGKTAKELKRAFKEDAGGAIEDLIAQLGAMPKDKRLAAVQDLFGKGSGITRLVLGLAESFDKNLAPSLDTATESWEDATAAQLEFEKRNATVKSAIARLKNGVVDAAISIGEGFTPALGRAADKLSEFLKQDGNRAFLTSIGEDIGKSIDKIDWKEVVDGAKSLIDVMKTALGFAKNLYDAFSLLPTPLKGAVVGLAALDKLSGGLIGGGLGGIVGGLGSAIAKSIAASIPFFGKAFVQPVFVTNMGVGGMGGGGGVPGKGGMGVLSKLFLVGEAIGLIAAVEQVRSAISDSNTEIATELQTQTGEFIASKPDAAALQNALSGVNQGISDLQSNPLNVLVQGEALDKLREMRSEISDAITARGLGVTPNDREDRNGDREPIVPAIDDMRGEYVIQQRDVKRKLADTALAVQRKGEQTVSSVNTAKASITAAESAGAGRVAAATTAGASTVASAVRSSRPIVNVDVDVSATSVVKKTTTINRYGTPSGSRNRDASKETWGGGT